MDIADSFVAKLYMSSFNHAALAQFEIFPVRIPAKKRKAMDVSRRQFFKICAGGMAGTTVAALGFAPKMALAQARNYKLLRAKEIRNTCTYCSVGCGLLMYSLGDTARRRTGT